MIDTFVKSIILIGVGVAGTKVYPAVKRGATAAKATITYYRSKRNEDTQAS